MCVGATRNSKEIQPGFVQNKFDLFGSNLAYFLLAYPFIELSLLVSNIGVAQTKESAKSKIMQEKIPLRKAKSRPRRVFRITSSFSWPVDPITGRRALHKGEDIAEKRGSPKLAPAEGLVCKTSQQASLGYLLDTGVY